MEFKDIVVDNDAIVNTEPKELPKEAHDIPQGVKPHLNPNPGYGEDGKTVPAIKTDLVEGERGTPIDVVTEPRPAFKTVQEVYNFLNGIKIKGKNLEDYIDSQGGVTEEELQAALATKLDGKTYKVNTSITNLTTSMLDALEVGDVVNVLESANSTAKWIVSVANGSASSYKNVDLFNVKVDSSGGPEKYYLTVYHFHRNNGATTYTNSHIQFNLQDIVANQTLVGGEQDLTSILIGYNRYKIPSGTKLYFHSLILSNHTTIDAITTGTAQFASAGGPPFPATTDKIITVYGHTNKFITFDETKIRGIFVYDTGTNAFSFNSLQGVDVESDTVTEL